MPIDRRMPVVSNVESQASSLPVPVEEDAGRNDVVLYEEKKTVPVLAENNPVVPPRREGKIRLGVIDASSLMESRARDIAEASLSTEKGELHGLSGMAKKIWKYNLAREYYRQKEILKAKEKIQQVGSVFVDQADGDAEGRLHRAALGAIASRFTTEGEEMIHKGKENAETREVLKEDSALGEAMKDLVIRHGSSEQFDQHVFEQERQALLKHHGENANLTQADNLLVAVQQVREAIKHDEGIEHIRQDLEAITGQARAGVRTEAGLTNVDKAIQWLRKTRVGAMVNEGTLALAVGAAYSVFGVASQRVLSSKLAALASFGGTAALGAGLAAKREALNMRLDRAQHAREMAQGGAIDTEHGERRGELERTNYEMRGAADLTAQINTIYERDKEGKLILKSTLSQTDIEGALQAIAEAETRIHISDTQNKDLLQYSSPAQIEEERFALDLARAKAKVDIRKWYAAHPKTETSGEKGSTEHTTDTYVADFLASHSQAVEKTLGEDIHTKDELFRKLKQRKAWKAAGIALASGLVIGGAVQEAKAYFDPTQQGLLENVLGHRDQPGTARTPLAALAEYLRPGSESEPSSVSSVHEVTTEKVVSVEDWVREQKGTVEVKRTTWFDNDTKAFDKNELQLRWGGVHGTGIDKEGRYVFDIKHMVSGGSSHAGQHADLSHMEKLKVFLSASKGSQGHPFELPVNPDGTIRIDPKAQPELAQFFKVGKNGAMEFMGKYVEVAEVAESAGQGAPEKIRVLATHVGSGSVHEIATTVTTSVPSPSPTITPDTGPVWVDPLVPVVGRTPLEKLKKQNPEASTDTRPSVPPSEGGPVVLADNDTGPQPEGAPLIPPKPGNIPPAAEQAPPTAETTDFYRPQGRFENDTVYYEKFLQHLRKEFGLDPNVSLAEILKRRRSWKSRTHSDRNLGSGSISEEMTDFAFNQIYELAEKKSNDTLNPIVDELRGQMEQGGVNLPELIAQEAAKNSLSALERQILDYKITKANLNSPPAITDQSAQTIQPSAQIFNMRRRQPSNQSGNTPPRRAAA